MAHMYAHSISEEMLGLGFTGFGATNLGFRCTIPCALISVQILTYKYMHAGACVRSWVTVLAVHAECSAARSVQVMRAKTVH